MIPLSWARNILRNTRYHEYPYWVSAGWVAQAWVSREHAKRTLPCTFECGLSMHRGYKNRVMIPLSWARNILRNTRYHEYPYWVSAGWVAQAWVSREHAKRTLPCTFECGLSMHRGYKNRVMIPLSWARNILRNTRYHEYPYWVSAGWVAQAWVSREHAKRTLPCTGDL